MTKQEFLEVLECLVLHLESKNEEKEKENDVKNFEDDLDDLPF